MRMGERLGLEVFSWLARDGTLELTLPGGESSRIGMKGPSADLVVHDYSVIPSILKTGLTGFAEGIMDGRLETSDLRALLRWGVVNQKAWFSHPIAKMTSPLRRVWQRIRPERRHPLVQTMNDHYNLSNEFYQAWLDETMTYSSARFATLDQSLDDAQRNKYRTIADHAGLEPGMAVLEIGCGWGGFAEYAAAERGCRVTAITLSEEQAAYAEKRIAQRGLADLVEIRVQDFRDVTDSFDAVVSIEMIESVDESHWPALFTTIARSLRPGARAVMQIITIDDAEWERYRSRGDFIQQYIFPGGQVPAPKVLRRLIDDAGLSVGQVETFGLDYARTLAAWRDRFVRAWPKLESSHGLDERFHRMWDLYICLCEAGFRMGRLNVEQWVFTR